MFSIIKIGHSSDGGYCLLWVVWPIGEILNRNIDSTECFEGKNKCYQTTFEIIIDCNSAAYIMVKKMQTTYSNIQRPTYY